MEQEQIASPAESGIRDSINGARFFVGDQVVWQEHYFGSYVTPLEELYGVGSFEVKGIEPVPSELLWATNHTQWVYLEINGAARRFSGALLKKVC